MRNGIGFFATAVASAGLLAMVAQAPAQTATLSGLGSFFETAAGPGGAQPITEWGVISSPPNVSYPYLELREHFSGSSFDNRVFVRVDLSSLPSGIQQVTGARLGLGWFDNNGAAFHSDYVDLWAVPDHFTSSATFSTYDGANAWSDGPQAGIDGYARTGPHHLGHIWHSAAAPGGTPSNNIINGVQEHKEFVSSGALEAYLEERIAAGQPALFALSIGNGGAGWQRFISTSDNGTYWAGATGNPAFANQPYLAIDYVIPEPTAGLALLGLGSLVLMRRRRSDASR